MLSKTAVLVAAIIPSVLGQNANTTATSDVGSSSAFSPTPVTTAVPSATAALNAPVPGQGEYPPLQGWCNNGGPDVYCPGALLQDVQLARIFPDSKTFPDKPTRGTLNETLAAYDALPSNRTIQDIENFVNEYFQGEGLELNQIEIEGFVENPAILDNVEDPVLRGWVSVVNSYWSLLIRETNQTAVCSGPDDCESSLIPLNNTIVVPGGRYREIYYWDSLWIMEGLLHSELYNYAWDLLSNMMDFIEVYGFIPNGGRKYYLNRSQPPVFVQMVDAYVKVTGNYSVLERALPLGSTEMRWWDENRGINVTSPYTGREYFIAHYNVNNTAPRPEGYVEDFLTVHESSPMLNETEQAALYAELATGAESGWDYSVRWCKEKILNLTSNDPALRQLNARAIIPVDLTALLAGDHALLANYYELWANMSQGMGTNSTSANSTSGTNSTMTNSSMGAMGNWSAELAYNRQRAQEFYDATLDLHWDVEKAWFYDFNTTGNDRSEVYTPSGTFPLWQNITPTELTNNETLALAIVSGQRYLLGKYAGLPSVNSLYESGLNWDFPNAWPPTLHTTIKSFETLGRVIANASTLNNLTLAYGGVTQGQLGVNETDIPVQPQSTIGNTSLSVPEAEGKPWPLALSIEYANRYMQAAFCSWYSTGGEIEGLLTQLPISDLNSTGTYTPDQTGVMFEKFNATEPDAAGGGGEYTVQVGFGWTNGVVLWIAGEYGQYLPEPTCPLIPIVEITNSTSAPVTANTTGQSAVRLFQGYRIPRD